MQKTRLEILGIVIAAIAAAAGVIQAWTAWKADQKAEVKIDQTSPSPTAIATPNSSAEIKWESEVDANYTTLQNLLKARKYKEADQETVRMLLYVARRQKEGWLDTKAIDSFPCQDLRTIDQIWVQNSNGRFGFSIQRQVYNQAGKDWVKFADQVEWIVNGKGKSYDELIWEIRAPQGHLPGVPVGVLKGVKLWGVFSLEPRLAKCNI